MQIEKLHQVHIPQILKLEEESAPKKPLYSPYNRAALEFIFDNSVSCGAIGLFDVAQLIGWGAFRTGWKEGTDNVEICSIVIDKDRRGQGFGRQVLQELKKILIEDFQIYKFFLTVSPQNVAAYELYKKDGWIKYDSKKDVYGPGADRIYMKYEERR